MAFAQNDKRLQLTPKGFGLYCQHLWEISVKEQAPLHTWSAREANCLIAQQQQNRASPNSKKPSVSPKSGTEQRKPPRRVCDRRSKRARGFAHCVELPIHSPRCQHRFGPRLLLLLRLFLCRLREVLQHFYVENEALTKTTNASSGTLDTGGCRSFLCNLFLQFLFSERLKLDRDTLRNSEEK